MESREGETNHQATRELVETQKELMATKGQNNEAKLKEGAYSVSKGLSTLSQPIQSQELPQVMRKFEEWKELEMEMQAKFDAGILKNWKEKQLERQNSWAPIMDFLQTKPLSFSIAVEPMEAEHWLMDTPPQT
jgi:hypothetical protein